MSIDQSSGRHVSSERGFVKKAPDTPPAPTTPSAPETPTASNVPATSTPSATSATNNNTFDAKAQLSADAKKIASQAADKASGMFERMTERAVSKIASMTGQPDPKTGKKPQPATPPQMDGTQGTKGATAAQGNASTTTTQPPAVAQGGANLADASTPASPTPATVPPVT
jgi:hypothetical protein